MNEESEFDPANRHLCPDGSCTGLVGSDGRCAVCGREGGAPPARGPGLAAVDAVAAVDAGADAPESPELSAAGEADGFDASRRLCEDGSCVGIVGADGRCGVCGRVAGS